MTNIVDRLREWNDPLCADAFDEIVALRAQVASLTDLLRSVVEYAGVEGLGTDEIKRINAALMKMP